MAMLSCDLVSGEWRYAPIARLHLYNVLCLYVFECVGWFTFREHG